MGSLIQTGSLFFHQAYQGRTVELTLMQGWLRALYLDGFPVQEPARVREVLGELRIQRQGAFEFQRQEFGAGTAILYALRALTGGGRDTQLQSTSPTADLSRSTRLAEATT